MKVLLIEDNLDMSRALTRALEKRGFRVSCCNDGISGLHAMTSEKDRGDIVLLDLSLPMVDGLHLLQRARSAGVLTPVLILTARGAVGDRIAGLNAGGDDYMSKPFDLDELEARIRALLRRARIKDTADFTECGKLSFHPTSGAFYCGDAALELTPREHALLKTLIATPGRAVTKERLLHALSSEENIQLDAVEVVIHRLRKKLTDTTAEIITLRGLGYLLRAARTN